VEYQKAEFYPDSKSVENVLGKSYGQTIMRVLIFLYFTLFCLHPFFEREKIGAEITDSVLVSNSAFLKPHAELLTKLFCGSL
jgi:hypothetical protein